MSTQRLNIRQLTVPSLRDDRLMDWEFDPHTGDFLALYHRGHVTEDLMRDLREYTRHMMRSAVMVASDHKIRTLEVRFEHHDFSGDALVCPRMFPDEYVWFVDPHHYSRPLLRETNAVLLDVTEHVIARWDLVREPNIHPAALRQQLSREVWQGK
jgi:hypothetical protein